MDDIEQLQAIFRDEAGETSEELARNIESLRSCKDEEYSVLLSEAIRAAHNLKGSAATMDFEELATACHSLEDTLCRLSKGAARPRDEELDALIDSASNIQSLTLTTAGTTSEPAGEPREKRREIDCRDGADNSSSDPATEEEEKKESRPESAANDVKIRLDASRLDQLLSNSVELLVTHSRMAMNHTKLKSLHQELRDYSHSGDQKSRVDSLSSQLDALVRKNERDILDFSHLAREINDSVKSVRMLPISSVAPSWRQTIRESARTLGKKVEVEIRGEEIELDKYLLDHLYDPVVHLLRNAVDHGIETPQARIACGKSEYGLVRITAEIRGSMVQIEINDDGGGLDSTAIGRAGVQSGIIEEERLLKMSKTEILGLVFEAGFTTSSTVNSVSGRGMGMDIVVQRLKKIGGSVQIAEASELGGACFRLMLPLSLLSIQGLLVRASEEVYAIPVDYIDRTIVISANDIRRVDGSPIVVLDELEPMRIQWLSSLLFERLPPENTRPNVVVTSSGGNHLGLVVDEVIGELEFVLKPLPWNLRSVPGINGAIILVDGSVALSVDVPAVLDAGLGEPVDMRTNATATGNGRSPSVLVADDSVSFRTLFSNMLAPAGYEVTACVDGEEAWNLLNKKPFDLLLTDVRMPGLDGFELTRKVRGSEKLKNLPVVMVTTLSDPDDIARGVEAGADEYVVKGKFDQDRILEAVNRLI